MVKCINVHIIIIDFTNNNNFYDKILLYYLYRIKIIIKYITIGGKIYIKLKQIKHYYDF